MSIKIYICCVSISAALLIAFVGTAVFAGEISVDFASPYSVSVIQAKISEAPNQALRIIGQLKRPHRISMAGHLHAYIYSVNGDLVAESKHRVAGLNSKRGGMMRVSFNVLHEAAPTETSRAFLEYHSPGHQES